MHSSFDPLVLAIDGSGLLPLYPRCSLLHMKSGQQRAPLLQKRCSFTAVAASVDPRSKSVVSGITFSFVKTIAFLLSFTQNVLPAWLMGSEHGVHQLPDNAASYAC
jgi:hypothetical protein